MLIFTDRYNLLIRASEQTPHQSDHESPMITSPPEQSYTTADYPLIIHTACEQEAERFVLDLKQYSSIPTLPVTQRNSRDKDTPSSRLDDRLTPLGYKIAPVPREAFLQVLAWHMRNRTLYQHMPAHINASTTANSPDGQPAQERSLRVKAYNIARTAMQLLIPLTDKAVP